MYARFPNGSQKVLRTRLRSNDDLEHLSAAFELITHELFRLGALKIIGVEPRLEGSKKSPDFLLETADGGSLYAENVLATSRSTSTAAAQRRLSDALHAIDTTPSPDFFLKLRIKGLPAAPIRTSKLKKRLSEWLHGLDYSEVLQASAGKPLSDSRFDFRYAEHGLTIDVTPLPRSETRGDATARAIGLRMGLPTYVDDVAPIRRAIGGKAGRYGDLGKPYVIAVNSLADFVDDSDLLSSLFGSEVFTVDVSETEPHAELARRPDGVWHHGAGPTYTRVSAVLFTKSLSPWSIATCRPLLVKNPWARYPLPTLGIELDSINAEGDKLVRTSGQTLGNLFGLPNGWPGDGAA